MAKQATLNRKQIIGGVDQDMVNSHRLVKVQMQAEHATCVARVDLPEYGIKAGEQFELVQSSYVGYAYIITTDEQHNRTCTCRSFEFRWDCKHVKLCSTHTAARYFARKAEGEHELVLELDVTSGEDEHQLVEDSIRSGDFETCALCSNPVKPGFVLCPWCSGAAA